MDRDQIYLCTEQQLCVSAGCILLSWVGRTRFPPLREPPLLMTNPAFFSLAKILRESLARSSIVLGITDWLTTTLFSLVFGVLYWCTGVLNPLPCGVSCLPHLPPLPSPLSVGPLSPPLKSNKVPLPPEAKPRAFPSWYSSFLCEWIVFTHACIEHA